MAASNVSRIHAETVSLLALAAASTRFRSPELNRTGTMLPFATALASLGRPGFLGLGNSVLLDGWAMRQSRNHCDLLIGAEYVCHKASLE